MRLLAMLAIASFAASASPAQAEVTTHVREDISGTIVNPCNGEDVSYTGTLNYVFRTTFDGNGGLHLGVHLNAQVKGTGATTGAKYSANEQLNESLNLNGAFEDNFTHSFKVIGQGKVPNFVFFETAHITVNANGDVVVNRAGTRAACK